MRISELLNTSSILLNFEARNKPDALKQLTRYFVSLHPGMNQQSLLKTLMKRERLGSTGIGNGVAMPHAGSKQGVKLAGLLAISKEGVEFNALDGELVHFLFLIVYPRSSVKEHLLALSMVAKLLRDKFVRDLILKAEKPENVIEIFLEEEKAKDPKV